MQIINLKKNIIVITKTAYLKHFKENIDTKYTAWLFFLEIRKV